MIIERGKYRTMYYAIYKDEHNLIGFIGNYYGFPFDYDFPFDIDIIDECIPTNLDYYILRNECPIFGLDNDKEWIGTDYNLDTPIDNIRQDMKKVIDVLMVMVSIQASGQVDF